MNLRRVIIGIWAMVATFLAAENYSCYASNTSTTTTAIQAGRSVSLEGELMMYVIDNCGNSKRVYDWVETDWTNEVLIYVLKLNAPTKIVFYNYDETATPVRCEEVTNEVVIAANDGSVLRRYANKKVEVTGVVEFRNAGWRNYNGFCFLTQSIAIKQ